MACASFTPSMEPGKSISVKTIRISDLLSRIATASIRALCFDRRKPSLFNDVHREHQQKRLVFDHKHDNFEIDIAGKIHLTAGPRTATAAF